MVVISYHFKMHRFAYLLSLNKPFIIYTHITVYQFIISLSYLKSFLNSSATSLT